MMDADKTMESLWSHFEKALARSEEAFAGIAAGDEVALSREEIVGHLRELRNARREFMAACGDMDDAWFNGAEANKLTGALSLSALVAVTFKISDAEIDAAKLPFKTSTGRETMDPQFPNRFDM